MEALLAPRSSSFIPPAAGGPNAAAPDREIPRTRSVATAPGATGGAIASSGTARPAPLAQRCSTALAPSSRTPRDLVLRRLLEQPGSSARDDKTTAGMIDKLLPRGGDRHDTYVTHTLKNASLRLMKAINANARWTTEERDAMLEATLAQSAQRLAPADVNDPDPSALLDLARAWYRIDDSGSGLFCAMARLGGDALAESAPFRALLRTWIAPRCTAQADDGLFPRHPWSPGTVRKLRRRPISPPRCSGAAPAASIAPMSGPYRRCSSMPCAANWSASPPTRAAQPCAP